ncbi:TPA: fimbrial protein [Citrobacter amalonaticus]|jgi:major type 1 subunit fimbrin (pilin)|nr:fimbrial protein [Citrobacter amalonaticus]
MKLRKLYMVMSACALVSLSGINAANAAGTGTDKGKIQFSGEVIASTCEVSLDASAADGTVTLDKVSTTTIAGVGTTALPAAFVISVTGCSGDATDVGVSFAPASGAPDSNGNLANEDTATTPTKVSLQLLDAGTPINLNGDQSKGSKFTLVSGAGSLTYQVRYYSNDAAPAVGKVTANATYELAYN